jgi:hypothetical protein
MTLQREEIYYERVKIPRQVPSLVDFLVTCAKRGYCAGVAD